MTVQSNEISRELAEKLRLMIERDYAAAARNGDPDAYASLYAEDAVWCPPDRPDAYGPEAIRVAEAPVFETVELDPSIEATEVRELVPGIGLVLGMAKVTVKTKATGETSDLLFRAFWLLEQEAGEWKITRQIWNQKPA